MKIHHIGNAQHLHPPQKPKPCEPWAGLSFRCPECGCTATVEATDDFHAVGLKRWFNCPNQLCNELIYLAENPLRIVDYRGETISDSSIYTAPVVDATDTGLPYVLKEFWRVNKDRTAGGTAIIPQEVIEDNQPLPEESLAQNRRYIADLLEGDSRVADVCINIARRQLEVTFA